MPGVLVEATTSHFATMCKLKLLPVCPKPCPAFWWKRIQKRLPFVLKVRRLLAKIPLPFQLAGVPDTFVCRVVEQLVAALLILFPPHRNSR